MQLTDLSNIGPELSKKLAQAGIPTPARLKNAGSWDAFIKLHTIDSSACLNMLYALEGAISGIMWHSLDRNTKSELKEFYKSICRDL